ncbi:trinucleotide repeat-containing gene 6C protein-like isoform X2 [Liolophura sinensis]|uniref:trinucleotide repeat-containing gene 6C protein-like isoform X2 n=1 Tax=Liolophura sinensis TaxID=3198878 RepID=UPI0031597CBB
MQQAAAGKKPSNQSGSRSGWGEGDDDGGWSQGPPATGSGWTELECAASSENGDEIGTWHNPPESSWSANNNEIIVDSRDKEAWPSIGDNSEETSESGEADNCSVKSGSVISSSSNQGQSQEAGQGSSAIHGQSASSIWGASNSSGQGSDSNVWGIGSTPSPSANMNSIGWGNLPASVSVNNQGHNMQPSASSAGSDSAQEFTNSSPFSGWGVSAAQGSSPMPQYSMQMPGSGNKEKLHGFLPNGGAQMDKSNGSVFGGDQIGSVLQGISLSSGFSKISTGQDSGLSNSRPSVSLSSGNGGQTFNSAGKSGSGNNGSQWGAQTNPIGWASPSANVSSGNGKPNASGWSNPNSGTSPNPAAGEWGSSDKPNSQWSSASSPWGTTSSSVGTGGITSGGSITTPGASNPNPPPKLPNTWAQAAGKGLNLNTMTTTSTTPSVQSSNKSQITAGSSASQTLLDPQEQEIRRAIESNTGWGQTPVRQDTNWDVDSTPSPMSKHKYGASEMTQPSNVWNNNNGTAIWEPTKENKPSSWQAGAANHTGGPPWEGGERHDPSAWGGAPSSRTPSDSSPGPWATNSEKPIGTWGGNTSQPTDWGRPKTETGSWAGSSDPRSRNSTSSWGDTAAGDSTVGWDSQPPNRRSVEDMGTTYWGEPQMTHQNRPPPTNWNTPPTPATPLTPRPKPEEEVWSKPSTKGPPPPSAPSGWGDPSPPSTKVDDGTSIWAANNQHQARAGGWGDTGWGSSSGAKPKMSSSSWEGDNMTWNPNGGRKPGESWTPDDNGGDSPWGDTDMGNWEGSQETNHSWNIVSGFKKRPSIKGANFSRGPGQPPQMRIKLLQQLMDMGYKKDEAQHALINNNMSFENALADLKGGATFDRKDQDIDVFSVDGAKPRKLRPDMGHPINDDISDTQLDANPYVPTISMQNTPFPNAQIPNQQMFASPMKQGPSLNPSSLNASNPSINSLQQKIIQQKILSQLTPTPPPPQPMNTMNSTQGPAIRGQIPPQAQTVQQQMAQQQILQQLRMAVQAGLISQQLLNQHLPPTILLMLQQLLQLQTFLQQLVTKQQVIQQNKAGMNPAIQRQQLEQVGLAIAKIRQQMLQLQQQIAQAQQQLLSKHPSVSETPDPMIPIQQEIGLTTGVPTQPQSRLTQWKRQTPDKEVDGVGDDLNLNKAVGSKPLHQSHSTPNLGKFESLNIGGDSTWSSVSTNSTTPNWPTMSVMPSVPGQPEGKGILDKESQAVDPATTTSNSSMLNLDNIIHEFVPGKPWQGMTKNVEDDPHITPGSFSRSLSVNTIKDEYLSNLAALTKTSPNAATDQQMSSQLTSQPSSTWSKDYPRSATGANQNLSSSKLWNDAVTPTSLTSELWGVPLPKSSAAPSRPPPGLSHQAKSGWGSGVQRQQSWAGSTGGSAFTPDRWIDS